MRLLGWYDAHARVLPWRAPPGGQLPDPYRVWLSEVMLQQTTVAAAIPYFERFTNRWPSVTALAAADEGEVMAAWAGLGYYARARNLVACARAVAAMGGLFPQGEEALRQLPGLGAYTAAAVAAIAFGQRAVVVDANVERVVSRLFAIATPLPAAKAEIRAAADSITPAMRAGDFAQGIMDLGSSLCSVRAPACLACPLRQDCAAHRLSRETEFPVKAAKAPKPERRGRAFWIMRDAGRQGAQVWLVRRPARGMLGGMLALPDDGWSARGDGHGQAPALLAGHAMVSNWPVVGEIRHVFTHFALRLELAVYSAMGGAGLGMQAGVETDDTSHGQWWPLARLDEAGLPTLYARAARLVWPE